MPPPRQQSAAVCVFQLTGSENLSSVTELLKLQVLDSHAQQRHFLNCDKSPGHDAIEKLPDAVAPESQIVRSWSPGGTVSPPSPKNLHSMSIMAQDGRCLPIL